MEGAVLGLLPPGLPPDPHGRSDGSLGRHVCRHRSPLGRSAAPDPRDGRPSLLQAQEPVQTGWPEPLVISFFHMSSTSLTTLSGIGT